ncbi:ferritin, partial [Bacillus anthracis]|uniref:ferritin-like domain-containing protein n=1 Tax=Bacillus anthracis TaxID=1392 RepID=UPI0028498BFF
AMDAYCTAESYDGFANVFLVQDEEESFHAMTLYNYINDRGERAMITGFANPNNEYESVLKASEVALEHERAVTQRSYNLSDIG